MKSHSRLSPLGPFHAHDPSRRRAAIALLGLIDWRAQAQERAADFPARPIRIVVPFPAGTNADTLARFLAKNLEQDLGQPLLVENIVGASGLIAAENVVRSKPDGYTLFLGSNSNFTLNVLAFPTLPYDPVKSFAPISMIASQPLVIMISAAVPARTIQEFIAYAKGKPGALNCGTLGSLHTTTLQQFNAAAGLEIVEVPYKSGTLPALMGGQIEVLIEVVSVVLPQFSDPRLRPLAVTSEKRSLIAPQLPTLAEVGYTDFNSSSWNALVAPAGTPPEVIERLNRSIAKLLARPEVSESFSARGVEMQSSSPITVTERTQSEITRLRRAAQTAEKRGGKQ